MRTCTQCLDLDIPERHSKLENRHQTERDVLRLCVEIMCLIVGTTRLGRYLHIKYRGKHRGTRFLL